jgi:hypothetical protein
LSSIQTSNETSALAPVNVTCSCPVNWNGPGTGTLCPFATALMLRITVPPLPPSRMTTVRWRLLA